MAGDIKLKYGTALTPTVTNLQSVASSSTFLSGWTSAWIDNTSTLAIDYLVTGQINSGTTSLAAGSVRVYVYAQHSDGSTAPDLFSAGTEGTEGTATVHDSEILDAGFILLWSADIDSGQNEKYTMPPRSIAQAFGQVPRKFALYVSHDTVAALQSSGNAFYIDPILNQYT